MVRLFRIAAALWAFGAVCNIVTDGPDWLTALVATGAVAAWGAAIFLVANETVNEAITEQPYDYGKGCRCDWLGDGTPEHAPSPMCRSLRPYGPRDESEGQ